MIEFSNYGQERDLNCTAKEMEVFDIIRNVCDDIGLDSEALQFVRKSSDYVSVVMESSCGYGLMDVARVKFTDRAKWIKIGPRFAKVPLSCPDDVETMTDQIEAAYKFNEPYM